MPISLVTALCSVWLCSEIHSHTVWHLKFKHDGNWLWQSLSVLPARVTPRQEDHVCEDVKPFQETNNNKTDSKCSGCPGTIFKLLLAFGLGLITQMMLASDLWLSSCLWFPSTGIISICYHVWPHLLIPKLWSSLFGFYNFHLLLSHLCYIRLGKKIIPLRPGNYQSVMLQWN